MSKTTGLEWVHGDWSSLKASPAIATVVDLTYHDGDFSGLTVSTDHLWMVLSAARLALWMQRKVC